MFPLCFRWAETRNPVFSWICRVSVMFPERKCHATFLSRFSSRISAVVCFFAICEPHVIGRLGGLTCLFISNFPEYIGDGNAVYKSEVLQILRFMVIMGKTQRIYTCNFSARKKFKGTPRFPSQFLYFSLNTAILKYRVETRCHTETSTLYVKV